MKTQEQTTERQFIENFFANDGENFFHVQQLLPCLFYKCRGKAYWVHYKISILQMIQNILFLVVCPQMRRAITQ